MYDNRTQLGLLDILTVVSFVIGLANYDETIDQNKLQEILNNVLQDIHGHLKQQDDKIEQILGLLKEE